MLSPFTLKAEGGACAVDRIEVMRALSILMDPTQTFELRSLPSGRSRVCHGQDLPAAVEAAWELSDGKGLYFCLNPVRDDLFGAASNKDVLSRRWMLIDVDTQRANKDSNATEAEKQAASKIVDALLDYLVSAHSWPHPVIVDSGNGWHLLFRVDIPNEKMAQQLVRDVLKALADKFDTAEVKVDRAVHNAARISKLPGSWARKGEHSDERPHRLARIVWAPEAIEVVSIEQLSSLVNMKGHLTGGTPERTSVNGHSPFALTATADKGLDGYVRSAVERECGRLAMTPEGNRDNQTNESAFKLGTMATWPEMNPQWAQGALFGAARQCGLDDASIRRAINSGWTAGALEPRQRPAEPSTNGYHKPVTIPEGTKLTIGLDEIEPKKVDWIYENRIAPGFISIFAGRTGLGKSFVTCDIVSKLSIGFAPPYSQLRHEPMRTLFISEDSPEIVIGPRLIELGADRRMVRFLTWEAMALYTLGDTELLGRAYRECGEPGLIVIDPPANFLGKIDEHKNAEVRSILKGLCAWLDIHKVACIFIMHVNKAVGKGLDAVERIVGSVAWGTSARITLAFTKDPNVSGQLLFGGTKNNLGPLADTVAFRIVKTEVLATVEWLGGVDTTMEDAMNSIKKKSRGVCAVEWLTEQFRQRLEWESDELKRNAAEAGISKNALWSPEVNALPISKRKRINAAGDPQWFWVANGGWPIAGESNGNVGNVGNVEDNS